MVESVHGLLLGLHVLLASLSGMLLWGYLRKMLQFDIIRYIKLWYKVIFVFALT